MDAMLKLLLTSCPGWSQSPRLKRYKVQIQSCAIYHRTNSANKRRKALILELCSGKGRMGLLNFTLSFMLMFEKHKRHYQRNTFKGNNGLESPQICVIHVFSNTPIKKQSCVFNLQKFISAHKFGHSVQCHQTKTSDSFTKNEKSICDLFPEKNRLFYKVS